MLSFSDSRNFSRTLAAIGLIVGPLLFVLGTLIDPAWDDDHAAYLEEVADGKGAYITAGVLNTVGSLIFIAGTIGVMRLLRGRGVTFGQFAAGLLTVGLIGLTAGFAFNGFDVAMADFEDRETMVAFSESLEDSGALNAYFIAFFFGGIVLGSILLAIALFRRRVVPIWSPILLIVAIVVGFVGGEKLLNALSFLILAAALAPLAMLIWSLSDDDWERWELPIDREAARSPAEAPPAGPGI